jgi:excinuclease ABC subunit A
LNLLKKRGFFRIYSGKKIIDLNEEKFSAKNARDIRVIIERFKSEKGKIRDKLSDSIEVTFKEGENRLLIINAETGDEKEFNKYYECCGIRYEEPEPRFFSFNNPLELVLFARDSVRQLGLI